MNINSISDFRSAVRCGPWAWGGYPCYWIMADGEACAFRVAKNERRQMLAALVDPSPHDVWRPIALVINWEDGDIYCAHTGERIPSVYAEPEGEPAQTFEYYVNLDERGEFFRRHCRQGRSPDRR